MTIFTKQLFNMARTAAVRFLFSVLLLASGVCASAQKQAQKPSIVFEETTWDFGEIKEADGPVSHVFNYINVSDRDVTLFLVSAGCSCTTVKYDRQALPVGGASSIEVIFDPAGQPGQFHQVVQLLTTGDRQQFNVVIEGVVAPRERPIDQEFPYPLVKGLQVSVLNARFGFVQQGTSLKKVVGIANASAEPMRLACKLDRPDPALKVAVPETLQPGETGWVEIEFAPAGGRIETLSNGVAVYLQGHQPGKSIGIEGYSVSTIEKSANAPSLRFQPTMLDYGQVRRGRKARASVTLFNDGRTPLTIVKAELPDGLQINIKPGTVIESGKSLKLETTLTLPDGAPKDGLRVRLFTNDPQRPVRDVVCKMTIK